MSMSFFAASNSADGFKNYYGECFERADRLFIIKGGPGTGKSTFMRRVADMAEARGGSVERYFCSSDHTSLDGVLFDCGDECVGIIDGTFPHPYIEKLPGLRDEIINTGSFWNRKILKQNSDKIRELCTSKTASYDNAYAYLRACGNLNEVYSSYDKSKINIEKMTGAITRLMQKIPNGQGYRSLPALVNSIGMLGQAHLNTFEELAEKIYIISDGCGAESFLRILLDIAKEKNLEIRIAHSSIYCREIDGIYLEGSKLWFVKEAALSNDAKEKYSAKTRNINMDRFCLSDTHEQNKKEKKYCKRLLQRCIDGAGRELARAGEYHFELEQIYKSAMDFEALERFVSNFCRELFTP